MEKITGYNENSEKPAAVQRGPVLTWIVCAACVGIFVEVSQGKSHISETLFYLTSAGIRSNNYWGLLTSVFTHVQLWHLFFNVYWLWILGGLLEPAIGRLNWIGFFLIAAVVSSGAQFAISGSTGIGASGVVYAMFGFMWIGRERYPIRDPYWPTSQAFTLPFTDVCTIINIKEICRYCDPGAGALCRKSADFLASS